MQVENYNQAASQSANSWQNAAGGAAGFNQQRELMWNQQQWSSGQQSTGAGQGQPWQQGQQQSGTFTF